MKKIIMSVLILFCLANVSLASEEKKDDSLVPVDFNVPFIYKGKTYSGSGLYLPPDKWVDKGKIQSMVVSFYKHDFSDGTWTFYISSDGRRSVAVQRRVPYRFKMSESDLLPKKKLKK